MTSLVTSKFTLWFQAILFEILLNSTLLVPNTSSVTKRDLSLAYSHQEDRNGITRNDSDNNGIGILSVQLWKSLKQLGDFKHKLGRTAYNHTVHRPVDALRLFAIYSIRNIVDHYIRGQSTVSLCFVDLSKAFDKMNHYALFLKLLKRKLPLQIIDIFVHWFEASLTCVRWGSSLSHFVKLVSGVRQGVYYLRNSLHFLLTTLLKNY